MLEHTKITRLAISILLFTSHVLRQVAMLTGGGTYPIGQPPRRPPLWSEIWENGI